MSEAEFLAAIGLRAKAKKASIVFPEGEEPRILAAAQRLQQEGLASPILLGKANELAEISQNQGLSLEGIKIIDPEQDDKVESYAKSYLQHHPKTSPQAAHRQMKKALYYGGMMLASGDAQAMVAGATTPTARVITASMMTVGLQEGLSQPSSFFLMLFPSFQGQFKAMVYADCALSVEPTSQELADIAIASAQSAQKLLSEKAKVAMLSFSTLSSAQHEKVTRVKEAVKLAQEKAQALGLDIDIEGEFQADTALIPSVAAKKLKPDISSKVAGEANVLIFPDLNAGNISYKLSQYLANAKALGPFLQGFAKPVSDLSRGASVEDIVLSCACLLA
ncbi:MAG: phosphate acetyltransferase [Deinococcales bacterium]